MLQRHLATLSEKRKTGTWQKGAPWWKICGPPDENLMRIYIPQGLLQRGVITTMKVIAACIAIPLKMSFLPYILYLTNDHSTGNLNTFFVIHLATHQFAYPVPAHDSTANHITRLPRATLSIDQSKRSPGFLNIIFNRLKVSLDSEESQSSQDSNHPDDQIIKVNNNYYSTKGEGGMKPPTSPASATHASKIIINLYIWFKYFI